jgi:hypothetical protein
VNWQAKIFPCLFLFLVMPVETKKRGFTPAEKWVIWGVFCMLVGLSTYRFTVFVGLLLLSIGVANFYNKQKVLAGVIFSVLGSLCLIFSKFLI